MNKIILYGIGTCIILLLVVSWMIIGGLYWAVYPKRSSMGQAKYSIVSHNGRDVFAIDGVNYSPTGRLRVINVKLDRDSQNIYIDKVKVLWLPGSNDFIHNRFPVIVDPQPGEYTVKAWDTGEYQTVGQLIVGEEGKMSFTDSGRR